MLNLFHGAQEGEKRELSANSCTIVDQYPINLKAELLMIDVGLIPAI